MALSGASDAVKPGTLPRRESSHEVRARAAPTDARGRWLTWVFLAAAVLLSMPAMLFELHRPDVIDPLESRALAGSFETDRHLRTSSDPSAGGMTLSKLVPRRDGRVLTRRPPGLTWSHNSMFAAARRFDSDLSVEQRIVLARLASVIAALVTLAAIYWAGHSLAGAPAGLASALICGSSPVFLYHARLAAGPMHQTAWSVLAVASALWAIRPFRPAPSVERQFIGWTVAGLATGMAIYLQGSAALGLVVLPILLMVLVCPHRVGHLLGMLAAVLIGVLLVMPWALFVQEQDAQAWRLWIDSFANAYRTSPLQLLRHSSQWTLWLLLAFAPWTLWLLGAAFQFWSTSSAGERGRLVIGWVWLLPVAMLLPVEVMSDRRSQVLPVLPIASLLVAATFVRWADLADEGRYPRVWRLLRWPQLLLLTLASWALPLLLQLQPWLVKNGWLHEAVSPSPGWLLTLGMIVVLTGIIALSWRWSIRHLPLFAAVAWALWFWALSWVALPTMLDSPRADSPAKVSGEQLRLAVGDRPLYRLVGSIATDSAAGQPSPLADTLLYADLHAPRLNLDGLDELKKQRPRFVLLLTDPAPDALRRDPQARLMTSVTVPGGELWEVHSPGRGLETRSTP